MSDGIKLDPAGERIVKRGGADGWSDDDLVIAELIARSPGQSPEDYQKLFVALRMEYGEDALRALRDGHVQFELRAPRDQPEEGK